jgi:Excalibur calcium-binding domain
VVGDQGEHEPSYDGVDGRGDGADGWRHVLGCDRLPGVTTSGRATPATQPEHALAPLPPHPHGVGRLGARDHTSGTPVTNFKRSTRIYRIGMSHNRGLDRDKDGIACEKA